MPTPFPGMDPYLEQVWPDLHNRIIAALADELGEALRPRYYACLEERTYLSEPDGLLFVGQPDVSITTRQPATGIPAPGASGQEGNVLTVEVPVPFQVRETYLEVREAGTAEVVTALELLSPSNKRPGEGRRLYEQKRLRILGTATSLVEVDLIRGGEPMPLKGTAPAADYRILICRGANRPRGTLHLFGIRDPIPIFPLPLPGDQEEPSVDLGRLLHRLYDRASYDLRVDYGKDLVPPLSEPDLDWVRSLQRR